MKNAPQGLGIWIAFRSKIGSVKDAAKRCVDLGASWVAPRAGQGGLTDPAFRDAAAEIAAYKAEGLAVYPWLYSQAATWRTEVEAYRRLVKAGADGLFIDAEIEWGNHKSEAVAYGMTLRDAVGDVWLADCPWPWIDYHPEYPTAEFAAFVDARAPQVYWTEISAAGAEKVCAKYESAWSAWEARNPTLVRPRLPIGVTYGRAEGLRFGFGPPPGEVHEDEVAWFLNRYPGASLYSLEASAPGVLSMLRARAEASRPAVPEVPRAGSEVAPLTTSLQGKESP